MLNSFCVQFSLISHVLFWRFTSRTLRDRTCLMNCASTRTQAVTRLFLQHQYPPLVTATLIPPLMTMLPTQRACDRDEAAAAK